MIADSFNDGWQVRPKVNRFAELTGTTAPWSPVTLPHDAMIGGARDPGGDPALGYFPGGVFEYRKRFTAPDEWRERRVSVEFEGVYRKAVVSLNGNLVGHRANGYANFAVALDPFLRHGEENELRVEARAHDDSRWYSGAGIYRDTSLYVGALVHVALDGVKITTPEVDDDGAVVSVSTVVENDSPTTRVVAVATDLIDDAGAVVARDNGRITLLAGMRASLRQRIRIDSARRWDLDQPHLYTCRSELSEGGDLLDEATTTFGIRTLALDSRHGLRINGKPVKLRGACIHHDNGVIGAATIARAEERRAEILKEAGFNAVRSAHHPMSKAMLRACDRVGVLVMDEAFDMWTSTKSDHDYSLDFPDWWAADIDAMVQKDFNHPCVVLYSIGNEIPEVAKPGGAVWSRKLVDRIRAIDDTRYVTNAINPLLTVIDELMSGAMGETTGINTLMTTLQDSMPTLMATEMVPDELAEAFGTVDVTGYNYTAARYEMDHELFPNRVVVGSETEPPRIGEQWPVIEAHGHLLGDFTWTGWDYLGEAGIGRTEHVDDADAPRAFGFHGDFPWLTAWCGDIDITGHRLPISYYREIVFGLRSDPYISVHRPENHGKTLAHSSFWSWSDSVSSWTWDAAAGAPVHIEVYSDADEVEVLVNGRSVGVQPAGVAHRFLCEFDTGYEPGEVVAVARSAGEETGRTVLRSASGPLALAATVDRESIRADHADLAYVTFTLVDAAGNLYNTRDRSVTLTLDGPAHLQGFGSGHPAPEETFLGEQHTTFDGRALAAVRPTGPGAITVTATADGCAPATVHVTAS